LNRSGSASFGVEPSECVAWCCAMVVRRVQVRVLVAIEGNGWRR
jgi:hypothetical protein